MVWRALYVTLLRLHPKAFRERFGDEMAGIFDEEARNGIPFHLLFDAFVSLGRQRGFRSAYSRRSVAATSAVSLFQTLDTPPLRPSVLMNGAGLSLFLFAAVSFVIGRVDESHAGFLFGAAYPRSMVRPVNTSPEAEGEPTTEIKIGAPSSNRMDRIAEAYFELVRVLGALDRDHDYLISAMELAGSRLALATLDHDGDGGLSAAECGFSRTVDFPLDDAFIGKARLRFMATHPVILALDTDGDGTISASEIRQSSQALKVLDQNNDGSLTVLEVLPLLPAQWQADALFRGYRL